MFLLAHRVGLAEQRHQCLVQVFGLGQTKGVDVVVRRNFLDAVEEGVLRPPLQPQPAFQSVLPGYRARKPRAGLKDDARLLRIHRHRPEATDNPHVLPVQLADE